MKENKPKEILQKLLDCKNLKECYARILNFHTKILYGKRIEDDIFIYENKVKLKGYLEALADMKIINENEKEILYLWCISVSKKEVYNIP